MRQSPAYTSWKITCPSSEEAQALHQWLTSQIDLDRILTNIVRVYPDGVEQAQSVRHRLGDYFATIRMLPDSQADSASFRLVFQRRPDAGRYWKDLMVNILQETEAAPERPLIELESKGAEDPILHASTT
jgi:hypothetical protein